ncbi:TetR/AcrR family transcriptional regulator [Kribbella sp. NPDC056861]|uniref:TetR/AcrR family transcriptional regulator n=1 Tax=Kribbella sp. NPDC056861 TaxID=3154857 RepID=UPI003432B6FD
MHHGNRHGRSEEARQSVLEAADGLLVEKGFAGLTMEGIATRAGVAKQTIYRWWPSKTEILLEAFIDDAADYLTPPDTGDLATDLRRHLRRIADFLTKTDAGAVFRALHGQAQHDPALAERLREDHLVGQRERDRQPLLKAINRGDLPATTAVDAVIEQLVGPIYYRVLVTGEPVPRKYTNHLVTQYLART